MFLPTYHLNCNIYHSVEWNQDRPDFGCGKSVINQFRFSNAVGCAEEIPVWIICECSYYEEMSLMLNIEFKSM